MAKRPHIVIFNPDQWRGDVLGHVGNGAAVTPSLDRLVETEAVSFRNAFCQNPVCTPSRCSFMTGWYPHVRGHRTMHHMLHPERGEPNLLRLLRENGYFVWWGGKNDLVPGQDGYEYYCDVKFQATDEDYRRWGHVSAGDLHEEDNWRGEPGGDNYYGFYAGRRDTGGGDIRCDGDRAMVLGAVDFLREYDGDRPLCLYLPLSNPHPPYGVEEPWFSMIDREKLPRRIPAPQGWAGKPSILPEIHRRQNVQSWSEDRWGELRAAYYGMCARLDGQFGAVVAALRQSGLYGDTALFFFSDHGDFTGDYGLVEKTQNTFEDCLVKVPFIIKPPAGAEVAPRVSDAIVELVDFAATVYDLAGIDPGYTHFGRSLLPVVSGRTERHREAAFCEGGRLHGEEHCMEKESNPDLDPVHLYWPRMVAQRSEGAEHTKAAMCRTAHYKYIRRLYERDEMYDLARDPSELCNLEGDPSYGEILSGLKERLLNWYIETCDTVPRQADRRR